LYGLGDVVEETKGWVRTGGGAKLVHHCGKARTGSPLAMGTSKMSAMICTKAAAGMGRGLMRRGVARCEGVVVAARKSVGGLLSLSLLLQFQGEWRLE
jgi:hypothetical protein